MSTISIVRTHNLPQEKTKQVANGVAAQFKKKFGVQSRWQGDDTLEMERANTRGTIHLAPRLIRLELKLGLMLAPFRERIAREMERILDELLTDGPR